MNTYNKPFTQRPIVNPPRFNAGRRVIHTLGNLNPIVLKHTR